MRNIFLRAKMGDETLSPSGCRLPHAVSSIAITASHLTVLCTPLVVNETPSSVTSSILYEFAARCARFKALWLFFFSCAVTYFFIFWGGGLFFFLDSFIKGDVNIYWISCAYLHTGTSTVVSRWIRHPSVNKAGLVSQFKKK